MPWSGTVRLAVRQVRVGKPAHLHSELQDRLTRFTVLICEMGATIPTTHEYEGNERR